MYAMVVTHPESLAATRREDGSVELKAQTGGLSLVMPEADARRLSLDLARLLGPEPSRPAPGSMADVATRCRALGICPDMAFRSAAGGA